MSVEERKSCGDPWLDRYGARAATVGAGFPFRGNQKGGKKDDTEPVWDRSVL